MKKVIICSVSIGLVLIIGVAALVLALIPVNKNTIIDLPNRIYIMNQLTEENDNEYAAYYLDDKKEKEVDMLESIYRAFNDGFGQRLLTAIFRGEVNDKIEANYDRPTGTTNRISKNLSSDDKFTIVFYYNTPRTIEVEGRDPYEYQYLFFEIDSSDDFAYKTIGVSSSASLGTSPSYLTYNYSYSAKVNLKSVYDYIWDLPYFAE